MDREAALRQLMARVLDGEATTPRAWRRAAARLEARLPPELERLVHRVHTSAFEITDDEIAALEERHSDDVLFEVLAAAALGASENTLRAGLAVLED